MRRELPAIIGVRRLSDDDDDAASAGDCQCFAMPSWISGSILLNNKVTHRMDLQQTLHGYHMRQISSAACQCCS